MPARDVALLEIVGHAVRNDTSLARLHLDLAVRGPRAIWDVLQVESDPALKVIDLGCGPNKQYETAFGVDRHAHAAVDVVTDLETGLPFADDEIDYVFAVHFPEHVQPLVGLMNEIHRVLKPGGLLHAMVPNADSTNALADPNARQFNLQTFRYFCQSHPGVRRFCPVLQDTARSTCLPTSSLHYTRSPARMSRSWHCFLSDVTGVTMTGEKARPEPERTTA